MNGYGVYVEPQGAPLLDPLAEDGRGTQGAPEETEVAPPGPPLLLLLQAGEGGVPPQQLTASTQAPPLQMQDASLPFDDVFMGAPFQAGGGDVFSSAPFLQPHLKSPHAPQSDIFLQAPFSKRTPSACEVPPSLQPSQPVQLPPQTRRQPPAGPELPPHQPQPLSVGVGAPGRLLRCSEVPLPQQPVAAHRVISSVGQQAAVGSVPVGPLHSWTVGVRTVMDPFMAAPFHSRGTQGKP